MGKDDYMIVLVKRLYMRAEGQQEKKHHHGTIRQKCALKTSASNKGFGIIRYFSCNRLSISDLMFP